MDSRFDNLVMFVPLIKGEAVWGVLFLNAFVPGLGTILAVYFDGEDQSEFRTFRYWIAGAQFLTAIIFVGYFWAFAWSIFIFIRSYEEINIELEPIADTEMKLDQIPLHYSGEEISEESKTIELTDENVIEEVEEEGEKVRNNMIREETIEIVEHRRKRKRRRKRGKSNQEEDELTEEEDVIGLGELEEEGSGEDIIIFNENPKLLPKQGHDMKKVKERFQNRMMKRPAGASQLKTV